MAPTLFKCPASLVMGGHFYAADQEQNWGRFIGGGQGGEAREKYRLKQSVSGGQNIS